MVEFSKTWLKFLKRNVYLKSISSIFDVSGLSWKNFSVDVSYPFTKNSMEHDEQMLIRDLKRAHESSQQKNVIGQLLLRNNMVTENPETRLHSGSINQDSEQAVAFDLPKGEGSALWPDPTILANYEKLSPGISQKVLETLLQSMSEESRIRRENEQKFIQQLTFAVPRGQYFALACVVITALLGGYLAFLKYPWASAIIVAMDVALLVSSFIQSSPKSIPKSVESH